MICVKSHEFRPSAETPSEALRAEAPSSTLHNIGHLTLWGGLTLLINLAVPGRSLPLGRWPVPLGTAVLSWVVLVEELSQRWLDNRTLDPIDLLANLVGIGFATVAGRLLGQRLASSVSV